MLFKTNYFYWAINSPRPELGISPLPSELNYFIFSNSYKLSYRDTSCSCPRRDLNPRPLPYQGSALPLSYQGNF